MNDILKRMEKKTFLAMKPRVLFGMQCMLGIGEWLFIPF